MEASEKTTTTTVCTIAKTTMRRLHTTFALVLLGLAGDACNLRAQESAPCWISGDTSAVITTDEAILRTELLAINLNDPAGDAAKRLAHGDYRLLGIGGVGVEYPSLDKSKNGNILCVFGARLIDGTSDVYGSKEHSELMSRVREYARAYNTIIIEYYKRQHQ